MSVGALIWRGLFLAAVVVLLAVGYLLAQAASWRQAALAELAAGAEEVQTAVGPQQVAIRGDGPPVLIVHGTPGGYDQALALADGLALEGFRVIAPSRPGYLGTPLGTQLLPMQQAVSLAALLDALAIPRVAVVAFSSGTPAAFYFAALQPQRVSGLVVVSGLLKRIGVAGMAGPAAMPEAILEKLGGDVGAAWFNDLLDKDPAAAAAATLPLVHAGPEAEHREVIAAILADPGQREGFAAIARSVLPLSPRETATRNDVRHLRTMSGLAPLPPGLPVLFVHGTQDPFMPIEEVRIFAQKVPGAGFQAIDKAGQLLWLGPDGPRAVQIVRGFLEGIPETPPAPVGP